MTQVEYEEIHTSYEQIIKNCHRRGDTAHGQLVNKALNDLIKRYPMHYQKHCDKRARRDAA